MSLRGNFVWTFLGNGVYSAAQWGMIIVLAKLGSAVLVGRYSLALAVTAPVFMFSNLNLTTVQAADVRGRNSFGEYLGLRLVCSTVSLVPIIGSVWLGAFAAPVAAVIALVALSKFVESISDVAYGRMQRHERLDFIARSMMMKGTFSLLAVGATQMLTGRLGLSLAALCAVWTAMLLGYDLPVARRWGSIRPAFSGKSLLLLLKLTLPLGGVAALNSLSTQIPRYTMERFYGERELGIFSAITALGALASMISVALSRSALPRLSELYAQRKLAAFKALALRLVAIGLAVGVIGVAAAVVFGSAFLRLVYTEEYAAHSNVLVVVMLSIGLVTAFNFLGTMVTAAQVFLSQFVIHVLKMSSVLGLCLLLVPGWGSLGAAWAVVGGAIVSSLAYWLVVREVLREPVLA
jgi:O-antigen/teichoic acid export membrane protein